MSVRRLRLHEPYLYAAGFDQGLWRTNIRSSDPLFEWTYLGLAADSELGIEGVLDIWADPTNQDVLLAAVQPESDLGAMRPSVFRSLDAGKSWTNVSPPPVDIGGVKFQPAMRRLFYEEEGTVLAVGGGPYRTSNLGDDWVYVPDTLNSETAPKGDLFDPIERHPHNVDLLWSGSRTPAFTTHLTKSVDGGAVWPLLSVCPPVCGDSSPNSIGLDPFDESVAYIGLSVAQILMRSDDGGQSWNVFDTGYEFTPGGYTPSYRSVLGDPTSPGHVWAAMTLTGDPEFPRFNVLETKDDGETWARIADPTGVVEEDAKVRDLEWDATGKAVLIGTSLGVYRYRPDVSTGVECSGL